MKLSIYTFIFSIITGISLLISSAAIAKVTFSCPRLEGQNFICDGAGGGGAKCIATSCDPYVGDIYTCQSVQLCNGQTCQGTKVDEPCPDPSTYSRCVNPPQRVCTSCPRGTAPPDITCTGTCYSPKYESFPYKAMTGGGGSFCEEEGVREICTITEGGKDCHGETYCKSWGTHPKTCETNTVTCLTGYNSTPNEIVGCSCRCGPTGMEPPGPPPACNVPADSCT